MYKLSGPKTQLFIVASFVWLIASSLILERSRKEVERDFSLSLAHVELDVTQLLDIAFAYNTSIRNQVKAQLSKPSNMAEHPLSAQLRDFPQWNAYGLRGDELLNNRPYHANLTGIGALSDAGAIVRNEIDAILNIDLSAPFTESKHSFIWAYYQSKHGFILLAPSVRAEDFYLKSEHFQKPYWTTAAPENNPSRETLISDLYDDGAGQGLMISISSPVYVNDIFRGVTAVDVGLDYLKSVLRANGRALDKRVSVLTKEGQLVVGLAQVDPSLLESLQSQGGGTSYTIFKYGDRRWMLSEPIKNKFYAVYKFENSEYLNLLLDRSALPVLVLSLFLINLFLIIVLYRAFSQTKSLSEHDRLSGLFNRITHEELSSRLFKSLKKSDKPLSIIMADLDHFKKLNDSLGHHAGDRGITLVASIIIRLSRKSDLVGRFGGEEFIITMPDTEQEQARLFAERIRNAIEDEVSIDGTPLTISLGVAESHRLGIFDYQELCKKADLALYQAKSGGRNRTVVFSPELDSLNRRDSELCMS